MLDLIAKRMAGDVNDDRNVVDGNVPSANQNPSGKSERQSKGGLREFFSLGEVGGYFFRKKDPERPTNINLKMMHGVNKISILIFLAGVIYLIFKLVIKPALQ